MSRAVRGRGLRRLREQAGRGADRVAAVDFSTGGNHRVIPNDVASAKSTLIVPPDTFARQLGALKNDGWTTITLGQLADDLEAGIRPKPKTFVITIDDGWADGYRYALPILEGYGDVATYFVIAGRIDHPDFLDVQQIRALVAAGMEIGDHTVDHVALNGGGTPQRKYEIAAAAATIAEVTGKWPETLAYPSGRFNAIAEQAVAACQGMKMAVIEGNGTYETWATRFEIPRLKVHPGTDPRTLISWMTYPWRPAPSQVPGASEPPDTDD